MIISKNKKIKNFFRQANQQGSVLVFTLIVMFIFLIITISITNVAVKEIKTSSDTGKSVVAYQVADSGMEKTLQAVLHDVPSGNLNNVANYIEGNCNGGEISGNLTSGNYSISFYNESSLINDCSDGVNTINRIKSLGHYQGVSRAVEVEK